MGRRIALVGALLVASGMAVLTAFVVPPMTAPVTPMDRGLTFLLGLVPMAASSVLATGAVLLALALAAAVTGHLPAPGRPTLLLWAGLGAWVLAVLVEGVFVPSMMGGSTTVGYLRSGLVLSQLSFVLQLGAAVLVALWVVALVAPDARTGRATDRPTADEVRA